MSLLKPRKPIASISSIATPSTAQSVDERQVRLPEVLKALGFSKSTLYKLIREGKFPPQTRTGKRISTWKWSDVQSYIKRGVNHG